MKTKILIHSNRLSIPFVFFNVFLFAFIWEAVLKGVAELTRFADRQFYEVPNS